MLKVEECMIREVLTAKRGTPLKDIITFFKEKHVHVLPVIDAQEHLVGSISLNEITTVFQPQSAQLNELLKSVPFVDTVPEPDIDLEYVTPEMGILVIADEIMSKQYFSIAPGDSIGKAYAVMKANNTKLLMVTEEDDKLVGVLGLFDIIYSIFRERGVIN